jgi:hypothetical protein
MVDGAHRSFGKAWTNTNCPNAEVKAAIDMWCEAVGLTEGFVFRPVNRAGRSTGERLDEKVVWHLLRR